jgi:hypothetical protein
MFRRSEVLHGWENLFIYQKNFSLKIPIDKGKNGPDYFNLIGHLL